MNRKITIEIEVDHAKYHCKVTSDGETDGDHRHSRFMLPLDTHTLPMVMAHAATVVDHQIEETLK